MYKVVDLFAGAGGLSLGFQQEGNYEIVGVIENNKNALETYKRNHKGKKLKIDKDIREIDFIKYREEVGDVDVVIGGPPCQGFSNANRQKTKFISMNNALVKKYIDAVLKLKPKAFVMENVAMISSDVHKFFDSNMDHNYIKKLGVDMKEESYVIMNHNFDGHKILDILNSEDMVKKYSLDDKKFNCIKLITRYKKNQIKLENYFNKYATFILKTLEEYNDKLTDGEVDTILKNYIRELIDIYESKSLNNKSIDVIDSFVDFIKATNLMKELYENKIIFQLEGGERDEKIKAKIKTYTVFDYIQKRLDAEYVFDFRILNAKDYGAPQERRRFIMIGVRKDLKSSVSITFPEKINITHTVRDAIGDLEKFNPTQCVDDAPIKRQDFSENIFTRYLQAEQGEVYNHVNTASRDNAIARFKHIKPGDNFHSLSADLKENTYTDPTRTQNTIYLRLEYDKPCGTVVNVRKSMWIHPVLDRAISIREAARLQTFPDSYVFCGTKDSQYQQVGNAVPPVLARAIASELTKIMET